MDNSLNLPIINDDKFQSALKSYIEACQNTHWLDLAESYKFKFGRWLNEKVDFQHQSDQEILKLCRDSQEVRFDDESKGINFLTSSKRFKDEFIEIVDIKIFRELNSGKEPDEELLNTSSLSYPKISAWISTLLPKSFKACPNVQLLDSLSWLFDLEDIPKKGFQSFLVSQKILNILTDEILQEKESLYSILKEKLKLDDVLDVDIVWLVQDFILFIAKKILNPPEPNYWWVNQGSYHKIEAEGGFIWAPVDNVHHHKRLQEINQGDIIIHYANGQIFAKSDVISEYKILKYPNEKRHSVLQYY